MLKDTERHRALLRRHADRRLHRQRQVKKQIDEWIRIFRKTKPAPGSSGPLIPGDPEREAEAIRAQEGIPLLKSVVDDLLAISKKTGVPFEITGQHD